MKCRESRMAILAAARGQATDAERLRLDEHLDTCASCRRERAQWLLMERLSQVPAPHLGNDAQRQMIQRLTMTAIESSERIAEPAPMPQRRPWALGLVAAAVLALLLWRLERRADPPMVAHAPSVSSSVEQKALPKAAATQVIQGRHDGTMELIGAKILYKANTVLRLHDSGRQVDLLQGEVEVDVTPAHRAQGERFRVQAARFMVEVLGTRFRVTEDSVLTLRGRVRVIDPQGHELAVLTAGERWQVDAPAPVVPIQPTQLQHEPSVATPGAPIRSTIPVPALPAPATATSSAAPPLAVAPVTPTSRPRPPTARQRIALARSALADGHLDLARQRISEALAAEPTRTQRAAIGLLQAECLLGEQRFDVAIKAYQRVAEQFPEDPSGETAAFAVAQFLTERGNSEESRAAIDAYLKRYPNGRFVREVSEKLPKGLRLAP